MSLRLNCKMTVPNRVQLGELFSLPTVVAVATGNIANGEEIRSIDDEEVSQPPPPPQQDLIQARYNLQMMRNRNE